MIHIWLDDIRPPPHRCWRWCKTIDEALAILMIAREEDTPVGISFDDNLGEGILSGHELAKEIEASAFYGAPYSVIVW